MVRARNAEYLALAARLVRTYRIPGALVPRAGSNAEAGPNAEGGTERGGATGDGRRGNPGRYRFSIGTNERLGLPT